MTTTGVKYQSQATPGTKVRAGVGVVVRDASQRVLMEKRSDCGLWGLPGGRIEPGETILETVHREILEETGLTIEVIGLFGVYSDPAEQRIVVYPDNTVQLVDFIIEARVKAGQLICSEESTELRFFAVDAFPAEVAPPALAILRDLRDGITGAIR